MLISNLIGMPDPRGTALPIIWLFVPTLYSMVDDGSQLVDMLQLNIFPCMVDDWSNVVLGTYEGTPGFLVHISKL